MYENEARYILRSLKIDLSTRQPTSPISFRRILPHFPVKYREKVMDPGIDGMYIRSIKGHHIVINKIRPYTRRRFSLGHEFGHYYLGHDSDVTRVDDQNRYEEVQANRFSASLLAPADMVLKLSKERRTIHEMAEWFRISAISMAIRCLELGLRELEADLIRSEYYWSLGDVAND